MSATLRIEDFTQNKTLFPAPPPVIKVIITKLMTALMLLVGGV